MATRGRSGRWQASAPGRYAARPRVLRVCPQGRLVAVLVPDEGQAAHDVRIDLVGVPPAGRYPRRTSERGAVVTPGHGRWTAGGRRTHSRSPSGRSRGTKPDAAPAALLAPRPPGRVARAPHSPRDRGLWPSGPW